MYTDIDGYIQIENPLSISLGFSPFDALNYEDYIPSTYLGLSPFSLSN